MDANYLEVTVDGQSIPNRPYKPNYEENDYVSSYLNLLDSDLNRKKGIIISLSEYPNGYCLYLFENILIQWENNQKLWCRIYYYHRI